MAPLRIEHGLCIVQVLLVDGPGHHGQLVNGVPDVLVHGLGSGSFDLNLLELRVEALWVLGH